MDKRIALKNAVTDMAITSPVPPPASYRVVIRGGTIYDGSGGAPVLRDGKHTGAKPGRVVRGSGWTGWPGAGACKP